MPKQRPSPPALNRGDVQGYGYQLPPVVSIPRAQLPYGLENFAGAIGMPLDATMIEDDADSDKISELAKVDVTWLGVTIPLQNAGTGYATLVLRKAGAQNFPESLSHVYVGIDLKDRTLFDRLWEIVRLAGPRVVSGCRGIIELYKPVPPDRIPNFADILADLLGEWSRLWQRVGGLQGTALAR